MEDHGLILLGFIHTHPTFSAFLSSIDLHMQYLIQKDLPSAIAIVVSPKDGTQPIFRITPEGMNVLKQCNEDQDKQHDHITDITIYSECSVREKCHLCQFAFESREDLVNCGNCSQIVHSDCWKGDGDSCTKKKK